MKEVGKIEYWYGKERIFMVIEKKNLKSLSWEDWENLGVDRKERKDEIVRRKKKGIRIIRNYKR